MKAPASNVTVTSVPKGPSFSPAPIKQVNKVSGGSLDTLDEKGTGHC